MNAKDKKKKNKIFTIKNVIVLLFAGIIILYALIFYNLYFVKHEENIDKTTLRKEDIKISKAEKVVVNEILEENLTQQEKEEYFVEETELEYITKYIENKALPQGTIQVTQEGRQGKQEIVKKNVHVEDEMIEEQVSAKVTKASIHKIVEIGTGKNVQQYQVKVGDNVYVSSDRVAVMSEPKEEAQKVNTLAKEEKLTVLEVQEEWYKIRKDTVTGYVKKENTKYINPVIENAKTNPSNTGKKGQVNKNITMNMALNKPSGLSLEQFKQVLKDSKDKNKVFETNADYFYYIEQQYNINGLFVAAVGIHESAWGTSKISNDKKNLFGYGAYDANPYNGAYDFKEYSESIDLVARVFVKYYLNPKGTKIYGNEKATGSYYNGATLNGVNQKYATDKNWANGVFAHMKYLYNKL